MLDAFHKISGLKMTNEKPEALWIGALRGYALTLFPDRKLQWTKESVKALN